MAADRLRELFGETKFARLTANPAAHVNVTFNLQSRRVSIGLKWPSEYGDRLTLPCMFEVPDAVRGGG